MRLSNTSKGRTVSALLLGNTLLNVELTLEEGATGTWPADLEGLVAFGARMLGVAALKAFAPPRANAPPRIPAGFASQYLSFQDPYQMLLSGREASQLEIALSKECVYLHDLELFDSCPVTCLDCGGPTVRSGYCTEARRIKGTGARDTDGFLVCPRRKCKSAGTPGSVHTKDVESNFHDYNPEVMAAQHPGVAARFPFVLTTRAAYSQPHVDQLSSTITYGVPASVLASSANEVKAREHSTAELVHYSYRGAIIDLRDGARPLKPDKFTIFPGRVTITDVSSKCYLELYDKFTGQFNECALRYISSLGGLILKIDHGYKNSKHVRGMGPTLTIMNEFNQILGQWHGTASLKDALPALVDVGQRLLRMNLAVKVIYTDHPAGHADTLLKAFLGLGRNLASGDDGVKCDFFHFSSRHLDTFTKGHCSIKEALDSLSEAVFEWDTEDLRAWQLHPSTKAGEPVNKLFVRRYAGPPDVIKPKYIAWREKWRNYIDSTTGQMLFTESTLLLIERSLDEIDNWRLSDPMEQQADGSLRRVDLYRPLKVDKLGRQPYACSRGTNSVENVHSIVHHTLSGSNNSQGHADAQLVQRTFRINRDAGVLHRGCVDYGHYDEPLLRQINKQAQKCQMEARHLLAEDPPPTQEVFNFGGLLGSFGGSDEGAVRLREALVQIKRHPQQPPLLHMDEAWPDILKVPDFGLGRVPMWDDEAGQQHQEQQQQQQQQQQQWDSGDYAASASLFCAVSGGGLGAQDFQAGLLQRHQSPCAPPVGFDFSAETLAAHQFQTEMQSQLQHNRLQQHQVHGSTLGDHTASMRVPAPSPFTHASILKRQRDLEEDGRRALWDMDPLIREHGGLDVPEPMSSSGSMPHTAAAAAAAASKSRRLSSQASPAGLATPASDLPPPRRQVSAGRKRGMLKYGIHGYKMFTIGDMSEPVSSESEIRLYMELYNQFTRGSKTSFF